MGCFGIISFIILFTKHEHVQGQFIVCILWKIKHFINLFLFPRTILRSAVLLSWFLFCFYNYKFLFQDFKMIICLFLIIVLHITVPFIKKNLGKL